MADIGREYRLEVQSTADTAKTITGITKAPQAVVSAASHGLTAGDYVLLSVEGMDEVNDMVARVANTTTGTFELEGVNSTNFGTFANGTFREISAWMTVGQATAVDYGQGSAEEIDTTVLLDRTRRVEAGALALPPVTVSLFSNPTLAVEQLIENAAYGSTVLAWRATRKSGARKVWAGIPSTIGESVSVNAAITGSFNIVVKSPRYLNYGV
jgi:hypothetical protein